MFLLPPTPFQTYLTEHFSFSSDLLSPQCISPTPLSYFSIMHLLRNSLHFPTIFTTPHYLRNSSLYFLCPRCRLPTFFLFGAIITTDKDGKNLEEKSCLNRKLVGEGNKSTVKGGRV